MTSLQIVIHWLIQNPLAASALFFGSATVAVTVWTYVYDWKQLTHGP